MQNSFLVQSKDNNLIKKSSSGGVFAELARYILSEGGVVFGCAIERVEEGFDVKHIYIEDEKDLYKLQGSKYVQSRIGNTIKEAKEFLDEGRLVLFSGTPCQIAGLKAFLKNKEYNHLLTVDLSCTGTPSLKFFNDYIIFLENKYRKKIVSFEFRNKEKMGWSCGNALVTFADGKQKILYNNISSYLNLFINKKLQKESCQNCKFLGLERISDITVADAWGVDIEYPQLLKNKFNKDMGISLLLLNSEKSIHLFEKIKGIFVVNPIDVKKLQKYNAPLNYRQNLSVNTTYLDEYRKCGYLGVEKLFRKSINRKYYYYVLKNHTPKFIKIFIKLIRGNKQKTDCLLMTLYSLSNYGSILTAYALYKTLANLGYASKLIHYGNITGYGKNFIEKYLPLTNRVISSDDLLKLNKLSDIFILGSDNLINLATNNLSFVAQNLLNFTDNNKKRLMISGSIGSWDGSTKNKEEHNYIKYLLDRFNYISTREEHGKEIFANVFGIESDWINDPVFYLDKQDFINLTKKIKQDYSNSIMQYVLYPTNETNEIVNYYKEKLNTEVEKFDGNENVKYFSRYKNKSVENWLSAVINSKLIITDSFHCVAFCLIFNKNFVCIKNTHATVRFTSLFKRLGIQIPLIANVNELQNINLSYDKEIVNKNIENIRHYALEKIQEALEKPKKEIVNNAEMNLYNKCFIKKNEPWYKKNRLFYFLVIIPIVIPIKRVWANLKNE